MLFQYRQRHSCTVFDILIENAWHRYASNLHDTRLRVERKEKEQASAYNKVRSKSINEKIIKATFTTYGGYV